MNPLNSGRSMSAQPKCTAPTLVQQRSSACTCDQHLTLAQVAQILQVAHSTVWELVVARQEIPYFRVGSRAIRILRSDFRAYLAANRYGRAAS